MWIIYIIGISNKKQDERYMSYIMYLPDCSITTDTERFIKVYSDKYFSDYPQNMKSKEDEIIRITKLGKNIEATDIITLMRWKTGDYKTEDAIVDC